MRFNLKTMCVSLVSPVEYYIFLCADRTISMGLYQQNMSSKEGENVPTMNVNQESATVRKDTGGMDLYAILDLPKNAGSKEVCGWCFEWWHGALWLCLFFK